MHNIYLLQMFGLDNTVTLATRIYIWWIHNRLGKGMQKVIPSCTMWAIGNSIPSESQEYIPFIESNDGCYLLVEGK